MPTDAMRRLRQGHDEELLAVELEKTSKGRARVRRILSGYIASRHIQGVRYYATTERVRDLLETEVSALSVHALIEVRERSSDAKGLPAESRFLGWDRVRRH